MIKQLKVPIWIQNLNEIINWWYLYIDKTEEIINLLQLKYVFLSRPRRFWKSLLLDTIKELKLWNKDLFAGLYAEFNWNWENPKPIIYLDFSSFYSSDLSDLFKDSYIIIDNEYIEYYNFINQYNINGNELWEVIKMVNKISNQHVTILIDEYDKPIINNLINTNYNFISNYFKWFYSWIKSNDKIISNFILTWLNRVLKMSVFSVLNNLKDISYSAYYSNIVWYTEDDLNNYFNINKDNYLKDVKSFYNGYTFWWDSNIYNPFAINLYVSEQYILKYYWTSSWLPTAIWEFINDKSQVKILNKVLWYFIWDNKEKKSIIESDLYLHQDIIWTELYFMVLLINSWYLTLKNNKRNSLQYDIKIPNLECEILLSKLFISTWLWQNFWSLPDISIDAKYSLLDWLIENNVNKINYFLIELYNNIMVYIPFDWTAKSREWYFKTFLYFQLKSMNITNIIVEWQNDQWKLDLLFEYNNIRYLIEAKFHKWKYNESVLDDAINQWYNKYANSYLDFSKGDKILWIAWFRTDENSEFWAKFYK